jgi:hypothetical protein
MSNSNNYNTCIWHPIYHTSNNSYNFTDFMNTLEIINRMRNMMTIKSSDAKRSVSLLNSKGSNCEVYEINMYNKYHPYKHVESWGWVDTRDSRDWWILPHEQALIEKYGWTIHCIN